MTEASGVKSCGLRLAQGSNRSRHPALLRATIGLILVTTLLCSDFICYRLGQIVIVVNVNVGERRFGIVYVVLSKLYRSIYDQSKYLDTHFLFYDGNSS